LIGKSKVAADDEACVKLWNIYIDEAQRYDEQLLKGWKKDMEGMLLFVRVISVSTYVLFSLTSPSLPFILLVSLRLSLKATKPSKMTRLKALPSSWPKSPSNYSLPFKL